MWDLGKRYYIIRLLDNDTRKKISKPLHPTAKFCIFAQESRLLEAEAGKITAFLAAVAASDSHGRSKILPRPLQGLAPSAARQQSLTKLPV